MIIDNFSPFRLGIFMIMIIDDLSPFRPGIVGSARFCKALGPSEAIKDADLEFSRHHRPDGGKKPPSYG